jgi:hypothetical protein
MGAPLGGIVLRHGWMPHSARGLHLGQGGSAAERWPSILPWPNTIQIIGADNKTLARILATQFGYALQLCIGPTGAEIGDSMLAAELLGSALAAEQLLGAAVILDVAKAYDTAEQSLLFCIIEAAGCGRPMLRWVQLLFSDSHTYTVVNGHVSQAQVWQAGVRQDRPLSPLPYLFVAVALACWLR